VEFLLAALVSFGRLNGDVTQEKLNLFQLSSCEMAQTSAGATQVIWSEALDSGASSSTLDDVPDGFGRDSFAPYNSVLVYATENVSASDVRVCGPIIEGRLGCAQRYVALLIGTAVGLISGFGYFSSAIAEVRSLTLSEGYWRHLSFRVASFEQQWIARQK